MSSKNSGSNYSFYILTIEFKRFLRFTNYYLYGIILSRLHNSILIIHFNRRNMLYY